MLPMQSKEVSHWVGRGVGFEVLLECWCCVDRAPVKSVVYDTPYTRANQADINLVVELYRTDLEV
jgi:hypothetical protein